MKRRLAIALAVCILANGCTATMVTTTKRGPDGREYTEQHVEQRFDGRKFGQAVLIGVAAGLVGAAAAHSYRRPYYNRWYVPPVPLIVPIPVAVPLQQRVVVEHRYESTTPPSEEGAPADSSADDEYNKRMWEEQARFAE